MKKNDMAKEDLRRKYIRLRESLSPAEREAFSAGAGERILRLPEFREAGTVMLYRAVRGEMNLDGIPETPESAGKRFVYPKCLGKGIMEAYLPAGWERGAFGIPEPADGSERVPPEEIDLVICPGTAFDGEGHRLGMGGGYYDRFLPRCRKAVKLMAAFEAQRAEGLPAGETDVSMDLVVTEKTVLRTGKGEGECG